MTIYHGIMNEMFNQNGISEIELTSIKEQRGYYGSDFTKGKLILIH